MTGFLGPNGAGKTTTLRMLLKLVLRRPGTATIGGSRYADLTDPLRHVGAVLEASSAHKGRTGINHLRVICAAAGLPAKRADEVLELVGLTPAAQRKFKGYSLGMKQRLGIASAHARRPEGADPGRAGQRAGPRGHPLDAGLLRRWPREGRTVLVSSHLLSEMELLADDLVIIAGRQAGRAGTGGAGGRRRWPTGRVRVRTPSRKR